VPEQKSQRKRILVINDTQEILELFKLILEEEAGHEVVVDSYRPQMLEIIKEVEPDLIISDHVFGEEKIGWQLIQRRRARTEGDGGAPDGQGHRCPLQAFRRGRTA
jgi:CheY-like chemotaxis protein